MKQCRTIFVLILRLPRVDKTGMQTQDTFLNLSKKVVRV